ncbi:GAF and ANTAR domain-containing protein [Quadrisphaera sp. INWT6]|uniref:GAF and ANTAR domain-containing protein n=1 Tax=Quadrisphaera sp. INWT6 TaxID=2596917 RepID=UPI0018925BFB|nr:GAF and ANTAR domain-containing protein [Quadrisphaera sp. INWT6]MBF5080794.1 GAF and ANTAR domain-containing protein [Quadrisphaera sp. INWT6]
MTSTARRAADAATRSTTGAQVPPGNAGAAGAATAANPGDLPGPGRPHAHGHARDGATAPLEQQLGPTPTSVPVATPVSPPANSTTTPAALDLADQLARLATSVPRNASTATTADHLLAHTLALVPAAQAAVLYLAGKHHHLLPLATTHPQALHFTELQQTAGQGCCRDAATHRRPVRVDHLAFERRWPALAARADQTPWISVMCLPLHLHGDLLGELTVLSNHPRAFSQDTETIGQLLAAHAAVALAHARQMDSMHQGLAHRDVIGQAKGVLMERHRLSAEQAFAVLSGTSQHTNRKLADLAADLAETGELPATGPLVRRGHPRAGVDGTRPHEAT